jgi:hypothetical protein
LEVGQPEQILFFVGASKDRVIDQTRSLDRGRSDEEKKT